VLILLSPAKKLNFASHADDYPLSIPELLTETRVLSETTSELLACDLKRLMKLSDGLSKLNFERFQSFDPYSERPKGSCQAAFAFDGDTYAGLRARELSRGQLEFAQEHLGILSGLYGLLRPFDAIQPYRLEMGTRLKTPRGASLYEFWGDRVAHNAEKRLKKMGSNVVVNLASTEYASVIPSGALKARIVTPVFKEVRGGKAKIISFSAKRARGAMARFIIEKGLTEPSGMKRFTRDGYRFEKSESSENQWLFLRSAPK
jgi:cytoplasmic iron level regulating protein YaaA (DUF328/UPF0246 family)